MSKYFLKGFYNFIFPLAIYRILLTPQHCQSIVSFWTSSTLTVKCYFIVVISFISLMSYNIEYIIIFLYCNPCIFSLEVCVQIFYSIFWFGLSSYYGVVSKLYIQYKNPLPDTFFANIFSSLLSDILSLNNVFLVACFLWSVCSKFSLYLLDHFLLLWIYKSLLIYYRYQSMIGYIEIFSLNL